MKENIETTKEPYLRPVVTLIIYNNGKILLQKEKTMDVGQFTEGELN